MYLIPHVGRQAGDDYHYATASEAEQAAREWFDANYRGFEGEAILFLKTLANSNPRFTIFPRPPTPHTRYVFLGLNHRDGFIADYADTVTIKGKNKVLLPTTETAQTYYLDNPDLENPPTVTLASLMARIATVTNMVDASIAGHKNCLVAKLISERDGRPRLPDFFHEGTKDMNSGQPANSVIYEWNGSDSNGYVNHIVDGPDGDLFSWPNSDHDSDYSNGYTETLVTNRPLPRGQYVIHTVRQYSVLQPCGYVPPYRAKRTINVIPPAGILHELFFDPVTVGSGVAEDATNGVLKPASFTDANGASATIQRVEWAAGTVKVKVSPHTGLAGHRLHFIELDGAVSLSLVVDEATVEAANDTLSWSVSSQPWEDGDKLMVRIREAR